MGRGERRGREREEEEVEEEEEKEGLVSNRITKWQKLTVQNWSHRNEKGIREINSLFSGAP